MTILRKELQRYKYKRQIIVKNKYLLTVRLRYNNYFENQNLLSLSINFYSLLLYYIKSQILETIEEKNYILLNLAKKENYLSNCLNSIF